MQKDVAIVIGYKGTNSTGLIRSLGEAGYYVVFASSYTRVESKYTADYLYLPDNEEERLGVLCDYLKKLPRKAALFTGDDLSTEFIERNREILSHYCYCPGAGGNLHHICDKTYMADIAIRSGLNVPQTAMIDLSGSTPCPIAYPVILKPYAGYAGIKADIRICRNSVDYESSISYLKENGYEKIMAQQFLESDDTQDICLMGCSFEDGTVRIPCIIRKIRSYPLKQGSLSFGCVENRIAGLDIDALKAFVRATGYIGIFDIDVMVCNGTPYFIEINYRNGQNGYVSTAAGYNIPANWFRGMQGKEIDEERTLSPLYYMDEHSDYKHVLEKSLSLSQWLKDLKQASVFAMYHSKDLRPFLRQYVKIPEKLKIKVKQLFR